MYGLAMPAVPLRLFEARAAYVLGVLAHKQASEHLSDLLIGAEMASMCTFIVDEQTIATVADPSPPACYQQVL